MSTHKRPSEHALDIPEWLKEATRHMDGTNRLGLAYRVYRAMLDAERNDLAQALRPEIPRKTTRQDAHEARNEAT